MNHRVAFTTFIALALMTACAPHNELAHATYDGTVDAQAGPPLAMVVETATADAKDVRGAPLIFNPAPLDNIRFNAADQRSLAGSLQDELIRLRVFSGVAATDDARAARMRVSFLSSDYSPKPYPRYRIAFTVSVSAPGHAPFEKMYSVDSLSDLGTAQKWNINAPKSKLHAAEIALGEVIPDLRTYLALRN